MLLGCAEISGADEVLAGVLEACGVDNVVDATGAIVDANGVVVDATGAVVDATGAVVDAIGAVVDTTGAVVDTTGAVVDAIGAVVDTTGAATIGVTTVVTLGALNDRLVAPDINWSVET